MAMKPVSWPVAEEAHWKTWKFKDIITSAMEEENLRIRKDLANFDERFNHQERILQAVKSELETERAHKLTIQTSLDSAYSFIKVREKEMATLRRKLRSLYQENDRLRARITDFHASGGHGHAYESGICAIHYFGRANICEVGSGSMQSVSIVRAIAFDGEGDTKPKTSGTTLTAC